MTTLYEKDILGWVEEQVGLLKNKQWDKLDLENLIDEVESVGSSFRDAIGSYFEVLLTHMLKWHYQKSMRSNSWKGSIRNSQKRIKKIVKENPGQKPFMKNLFENSYEDALEIAIIETGLSKKDFPMICPWTMEQCLNFELEWMR